ncbi:helix-turn-helix domain-containing protein [Antarcticimicrobium luteum]|uniref:XRE family transcriptional regulator n=1 Tax=Antarcticimicrobium luteum TaxID=2547397 RepID=A0A4R5UPR4_9RHOB|nr:helix-turn-helix transcriptional regulator [Antarcticimicrobium luteum]TDK41014.1 XRE family transcriptional regulator [Antarcticimicrobium luteum]
MTDNDTDWYGPDAATFGDRVAGAREASGMTQAQLARRLGVKKTTVRGWEEDLSEPRANKLSMMAGLLNVSIMWLLTGEGDGMDGPANETTEAQDLAAVLGELRAIRADMRATGERAARLEKRVKQLLEQSEQAQV